MNEWLPKQAFVEMPNKHVLRLEENQPGRSTKALSWEADGI